jgi:hypothetical protein
MTAKLPKNRLPIYTPLPHSQLKARASFVDEWERCGRINQAEGARLRVDAITGIDRGPVKWLNEL